MRDELMDLISRLPRDVDIGVQIGNDHLDIADLKMWGDGRFVALRCDAADLRDVMADWGLPTSLRERWDPPGDG